MDFKQILARLRNNIFAAGLLLISFAAGFALQYALAGKLATVNMNDTPKTADNQYAPGATPGRSDSPAADPGCLFKGKPTKAGKKIYYYPGSLFYNKVKAPSCFDSEGAAQAAGFKRSAH